MYIAPHIGIIFLLMVSFFAALIVVNIGENIVKNTPQSKIFDSQRNTQEILQKK